MEDAVDSYRMLGVARDASDRAIASAYRAAALHCHPDKSGGDAARFHALTAAYDLLRDPAARRALDAVLALRDASTQHRAQDDAERRAMGAALLEKERRAREARLAAEMARVRREAERRVLRKELRREKSSAESSVPSQAAVDALEEEVLAMLVSGAEQGG